MPQMLFPKPFAKPPQPSDMGGARRSKPEELRTLSRALRLQKWRAEEQAEMRKQAAHVAGEWVSTVSGVALFIPEHMFETARGMAQIAVDADKHKSVPSSQDLVAEFVTVVA